MPAHRPRIVGYLRQACNRDNQYSNINVIDMDQRTIYPLVMANRNRNQSVAGAGIKARLRSLACFLLSVKTGRMGLKLVAVKMKS